jgi:hypothetical protein
MKAVAATFATNFFDLKREANDANDDSKKAWASTAFTLFGSKNSVSPCSILSRPCSFFLLFSLFFHSLTFIPSSSRQDGEVTMSESQFVALLAHIRSSSDAWNFSPNSFVNDALRTLSSDSTGFREVTQETHGVLASFSDFYDNIQTLFYTVSHAASSSSDSASLPSSSASSSSSCSSSSASSSSSSAVVSFKIQVVSVATGKVFSLDVEGSGSELIGVLKIRLQDSCGVAPEKQGWFLNEVQLQNEQTASEAGLVEGCRVSMTGTSRF